MQGQANEESLFRLQEQFQHRDSVRIIRNRVERFEDLVYSKQKEWKGRG